MSTADERIRGLFAPAIVVSDGPDRARVQTTTADVCDGAETVRNVRVGDAGSGAQAIIARAHGSV